MAHAFDSKSEVFSANQKFVVELDLTRTAGSFWADSTEIHVHEVVNGKRNPKWQTNLATRFSGAAYLSDDGSYLVLEDYTELADYAVYFFHNGKEIRRCKTQEITPPNDHEVSNHSFENPFPRRKKWNQWSHFSFLSGNNGAPCYCIWHVGETNWVAWKLADGERLAFSFQQQKTWNNEATVVARHIVDADLISPGSRLLMESRHSIRVVAEKTWIPDVDVCYRYLAKFGNDEDRQRAKKLLSANDYSFSGLSLAGDIVQLSGRSLTRSRGTGLLANFDHQPALVRANSDTGWRDPYLGSVEGVVQFPKVPEEGILVILLESATNTNEWPDKLPAERLTLDVPEMWQAANHLWSDVPPKALPKVGFQFNDIPPGEYRGRVLWKTQERELPPDKEIKPAEGDLSGKSETVPVKPGVTSQPKVVLCNQPFEKIDR